MQLKPLKPEPFGSHRMLPDGVNAKGWRARRSAAHFRMAY